MNTNFSYNRLMKAVNVLSNSAFTQIHPPNPFTISDPDWVRGVVPLIPPDNAITPHFGEAINHQGNVIIRSFGLYCNFADGLVWFAPDNRIHAKLVYFPSARSIRTGTLTFTAGSRAVLGVGTSFTTELAVGDIIMTPPAPVTAIETTGEYAVVDVITDNFNLVLTTAARRTAAGVDFYRLGGGFGGDFFDIYDIMQFNTMYPFDKFFDYRSFLGAGVTDVVMFVDVFNDVIFHTASIDPAFDGANVMIDAHVEVEYTPGNVA
jgi:hypothetical protein